MFFDFFTPSILPSDYREPLFRPPAEAESLIVQVTSGCFHNACSFCGMYKGKPYCVNDTDKIVSEILNLKDSSRNKNRAIKKVFLADADPFTAGYDVIIRIMEALEKVLGRVRVSAYARPNDILNLEGTGANGLDKLEALKKLGLRIAYIGLETGSNTLLKKINKGSSKDDFIRAINMLSKVGIKSSITAISGLGGKEYSQEHIIETAEAINACSPTYFNLLTLIPGKNENYLKSLELMNSKEILIEQREMVRNIEAKTIFRVDHSSNLVNLNGRLPKDRDIIIKKIDNFIKNCQL